jgi:ATP-dependent DNA helicase RecG
MKESVLELVKRWGGRESSKIEYKLCKSSLSKDLWETVSAFSNEGGGLILLGYERVSDEHVPVGVENPSKMLDDFTSSVGEKFNFCPMVKADVTTDKGKRVIVIEVKEAPKFQKPIYLKDAGPIKGGFKRLGATDVRLTDSDIQRYYQERMGSPDAQPLSGATIIEIDPRTVSAFRNLRKLMKPEAPELALDNTGLLKAYDLVAPDGKTLTAAGMLLFGRKEVVKRYFPAMRLDVIRIKGTEWGKERDTFLSRDLTGNLLDLWSSALDLLDRFFLVPFKLGEGLARTEEHAQRKAVREALTNLLMHQNYFHRSPAQVRVYNDRVEFYNPGHSLKDPALFDSPGSQLRNPCIAAVFYDVGWAETKGTGIKNTVELLEKEGYPLPEYSNDVKSDAFTMILRYPSEQVGVQVTEQVGVQVTEQVELMDRRAKTIDFCRQPRSLKEIMKFLGLKHRPTFIGRVLNPLLEAGLLKRTIPEKPRSRFQKYVAVKAAGGI